MKLVFWISLAGIVYTYFGYPLIMWILARLAPKPWKREAIAPSVSIIMAVHNGADLLVEKIAHLVNLDYADIREIIIVSDGSSDSTNELLSKEYDPRVKPIILEQHAGKAAALNVGIAAATSEILLFVDIRPRIAPGAVSQLVSNFADLSVGCVAGELLLHQDGHDETAKAVSGLYWRYEQWIRNCEAQWDSPVGVYGGFYAIRRELATSFPAGIILDDMFQPLAIIRKGYRSVLDLQVHVHDTWPRESRREFQRKVRTLAGNFELFARAPWALSPRNRVAFQLISHKGMRLVAPYLLIFLAAASIALASHSLAFAVFAALQCVVYAIGLLFAESTFSMMRRIAGPANAVIMMNVASVVGLFRFLFTKGPLLTIWVPAETRNDSESELSARAN